MYSIFDSLFDLPSYRTLYVISDSEIKELQHIQYKDDLEEILDQKKKLEEAYNRQVEYLKNREKDLKSKLKFIDNSRK